METDGNIKVSKNEKIKTWQKLEQVYEHWG